MQPFKEDSIVFYDDQFVASADLSVDPCSQSLHYGNGVFEGMRAYDTGFGTKIFKSYEHYHRLKYGASVMGISFDYSEEQLTKITYELLKKNSLQNAYIRPLLITGPNMRLTTSDKSTLIIQCWEWEKYMGDKLLRIKTSPFQRPNPKSCFVEAKITGHYINSTLSANDAKNTGYDEALLLDINGNVAECSAANVFMEKDRKLYTPPKGHIMAGITRSTVIDICKKAGYSIEERHFTLNELKQSDSCFFTGTAVEIAGLISLDEYRFPLPWEETLGYKLMHLYRDEVLHKRVL